MTENDMIQITERYPPLDRLLVVGRPMPNGTEDIFYGFVAPEIAVPTWKRITLVDGYVQQTIVGSVRTTDYWKDLPEWI